MYVRTLFLHLFQLFLFILCFILCFCSSLPFFLCCAAVLAAWFRCVCFYPLPSSSFFVSSSLSFFSCFPLLCFAWSCLCSFGPCALFCSGRFSALLRCCPFNPCCVRCCLVLFGRRSLFSPFPGLDCVCSFRRCRQNSSRWNAVGPRQGITTRL